MRMRGNRGGARSGAGEHRVALLRIMAHFSRYKITQLLLCSERLKNKAAHL